MPVLTAEPPGDVRAGTPSVLAATHYALDGLQVTDLQADGRTDVVLDLEQGSTVLQLLHGRVVCLQPESVGAALPERGSCVVTRPGAMRLEGPETRLVVLEFAPGLLSFDASRTPWYPDDDAAARYHHEAVQYLLEMIGADADVPPAVEHELAAHAASVARYCFSRTHQL